MNWKQLHTTTTPSERVELILHMLSVIETRQRRWLWARGRLVRERRRKRHAHFIHDRRSRSAGSRVIWLAFSFILSTLSLAVWLVSLHIPPAYAAPLLFVYNIILLSILLAKPYRRLAHSYSG